MRLSAKSSVRVPETVSMRGRHRPKPGEATHYFELWDVQDAHGRSRKTFKVRAESPRDFANWLEALDACLRRLRGRRGGHVAKFERGLGRATHSTQFRRDGRRAFRA